MMKICNYFLWAMANMIFQTVELEESEVQCDEDLVKVSEVLSQDCVEHAGTKTVG